MQVIQDAIAAIDSLLTLYPWISVFFGGFIGTILTQFWSGIQKWREERKERKAVRILLKLEIDHNIGQLKSAKSYIQNVEQRIKEKPQFVSAGVFLPDFQRIAFESQIGKLPKALTKEESAKVYEFYTYTSEAYKRLTLLSEEITKDSISQLIRYATEIERVISLMECFLDK
jgi:hypothetical protein